MAVDSESGPRASLRTRRLRLRDMRSDDLDFVADMLADPRVMRFYPSTLDRAGASAWIERQLTRYATDGHGLWLAELEPDGKPIGQIGLVTQRVDGAAVIEVAYLLGSAWWGRGYATEAAAAARDHAFEQLRSTFVVSLIRPVNLPSQAVARRLGMHLAGRTRHRGLVHDVFRIDAGDPRPEGR